MSLLDPLRAAQTPAMSLLEPLYAARDPAKSLLDPLYAAQTPAKSLFDPLRAARGPAKSLLDPLRAARRPARSLLDPLCAARGPANRLFVPPWPGEPASAGCQAGACHGLPPGLPSNPQGLVKLDYTQTEVILHLQTDVPLGTQAQTTILELERPPEPTNGLLDPSVDPCGGDGGEEEGGGYTPPGQPLSPTQQQTVNQAKTRAGSQLDSVESCRGLFDGLPTALDPPSDFLTSSTYRYDPQSSPCQAGVAAWTSVGSYLVHLCDGFFTGSDVSSKAATLIHEGLHSAGLPENPPDSNAMTSSQIQSMVRTNCGL